MVITIEKKQVIIACFRFFYFFFIINRSISARSGSAVIFKCLYNEMNLSRFNFCLNCKLDVSSVVSRSINDVSSSIQLISGVL